LDFLRGKSLHKTAMDAFIKLAYGSSPPNKSANVQEAIELCYQRLLGEIVTITEVQETARQLTDGPIPYSTHDLATATALNLFKQANDERRAALSNVQIFSRMALLEWMTEKKVAPLLARAFEDTLYKMFKT
jgi:hypothetical protein